MESLAEQTWDAVICGTGLQQSLLALALSRSGKQILHLDPNDYYGDNEAAFTLQDAEEWLGKVRKAPTDAETRRVAEAESKPVFTSASITRTDNSQSLSSRAYSLSLSPFIIHTRSALLSQLVSSRAYRQLEFLAVGAFYIFRPAEDASRGGAAGTRPKLVPIPSTREAIFATDAIQARPKRVLMKFLKFVVDHETPENTPAWQPRASEPLVSFLESDFKLDGDLRSLVLALTLRLDGDTLSVQDGLASIHRHITSMGLFGPGFAAVYPKYGGGSEVAQVGCRAGAVGGGVYMLGTGPGGVQRLEDSKGGGDDGARLEVELGNGSGVKVRTRTLFRERETVPAQKTKTISRLVAVVDSPLPGLFVPAVEDTPNPGVAVVALPPGSVMDNQGQPSANPVHVLAHSGETGECPAGQSVLYFTTFATPSSASVLDNALSSILAALAGMSVESGGENAGEPRVPPAIYQLRYNQTYPDNTDTSWTAEDAVGNDGIFAFPTLPPHLAFDDASLGPVKAAWKHALGSEAAGAGAEEGYMKFEDREGMGNETDDA